MEFYQLLIVLPLFAIFLFLLFARDQSRRNPQQPRWYAAIGKSGRVDHYGCFVDDDRLANNQRLDLTFILSHPDIRQVRLLPEYFDPEKNRYDCDLDAVVRVTDVKGGDA